MSDGSAVSIVTVVKGCKSYSVTLVINVANTVFVHVCWADRRSTRSAKAVILFTE